MNFRFVVVGSLRRTVAACDERSKRFGNAKHFARPSRKDLNREAPEP